MSWWERKRHIRTLSPLEGYNLWAATYQQESNPIKDLSDRFIEKNLPDLHGKSVLDSGCGTGKFCGVATAQFATKVVGLDLSPKMIETARKENPSVEFLCADLSSVSLSENIFDVVVCALALGHIEDLEPALTTLSKSLKTDGVLVITDFHPFLTIQRSKRTFKDVASGKHFEVRHYLHLFQDYFAIFAQHDVIVEVLEEPRYNNTPVVFGIRARKK
ncbi:MAG: class I SAM-dependent DNA methyltransferase [Bacteroidota bacterium]